jgi:hypothetical protein
MSTTIGSLAEFMDRWPGRAEGQLRRAVNNCGGKRRFVNWVEAEDAVREYRERVLFTNLTSYSCREHDCFHMGHDRFMTDEDVVMRTMRAQKQSERV